MKEYKIAVFWFRRDLRLYDNTGFNEILNHHNKILPIFIFDTNILNKLSKNDTRISFIYSQLNKLNIFLKNNYESSIAIYYGNPIDIFKKLSKEYNVSAVYTNRDYEPYARERDALIKNFLEEKNIVFKIFKDHVIFEKDDILKNDGSPYVVYTPYMKKWKERFNSDHYSFLKENKPQLENLIKNVHLPKVSLADMGFRKSDIIVPDIDISPDILNNYKAKRNFPHEDATSHLGPHLRFGTVSIRKIVRNAISVKEETFLNELIWREFFIQILWHYPHTTKKSFKEKYERIDWRNNEGEFKKWCLGETGYPIVDAGMRQLNETGYMHNRVRMIVGSFLCKHLLIDWRWGEAYFAEKLLDYELASNVGNWQWVAGCGVDAAPYFRIFNPYEQVKKFDKDLKYINKWVKDFNELTYPSEIVNHKEARERCLKTYKTALQ